MLRKIRAARMTVKGMVQVTGTTYRIACTPTGVYEVTRILDDAPAGAFMLGPPMCIVQGVLDSGELHAVARAALQSAMAG